MANADRDHLTVGLFVTPNNFYKVGLSVTVAKCNGNDIFAQGPPRS